MPSHLKDSKYDCDTNSGTETCDHPQILNKTFQTKGDNFEVNEHKCKNLDKIQTKCNTYSASSLQTEETSLKTDIHEDKGDNLNLESSNVKGDNLSTELSNVKGDNCEKSKYLILICVVHYLLKKRLKSIIKLIGRLAGYLLLYDLKKTSDVSRHLEGK
jgi:hypothetical protein